ncbi:MAG TPA: dihydrofolate reductase family protein [Gemmatimonadota bacterium]|nr:dihydrofolate reductase family protein [Gemmatimonadota bacterium]
MTARKKSKQGTPSKSGRRIRYHVACSLDGYIADEKGGADWIVDEPTIDFAALFAQFDTFLMGRKTYELTLSQPGPGLGGDMVVVSRSLLPEDHPGVTVIADDLEARVRELKERPGKDIWLFGGGELFRSLLDLNLVDTVEPAIVPVLVGGGVPFLPSPAVLKKLKLTDHRVFPSGIVWLVYTVQ